MAGRSVTDRAARRARVKRVIQAAVSVAIVVGIFVGVFPNIASYSDVWASITDMTWLEAVTLVAVGIWNLVTYWFVMVAVLPGLTYPQAAVANQASTAVANTLPGGGALAVAVSYAMYSSWGFSKSEFALATVVSGVWNNFAKLGLPVVALALLAVTGEVNLALVTAALLGVAMLVATISVFALMLRSPALARHLGEWAGRRASRIRRFFKKPPVVSWGSPPRRSVPARLIWSTDVGFGLPLLRWSATCRCTSCCWWPCATSASRRTRWAGSRCWRLTPSCGSSRRSRSLPEGWGWSSWGTRQCWGSV